MARTSNEMRTDEPNTDDLLLSIYIYGKGGRRKIKAWKLARP